ncbi:asparagine synthase (glutamine-hydrolyzing) [Ignicoccus hospitalis]|uniref:Putative asparagine synthetase [glutamine-hydrolyzing] n=1 Tax=Ignicoccus hospitalis (strain KIN4/I / DSM 18386 / JCM 14125) TaxID=453591 RepID=A8AA00_IGNH4|nr:asparagine synthase (glutamine-hydrolyzing) [Ignicoccus hospitalis]ABU81752.1 asparagine synthase (glutamine-hydrolyzing) [Ignicoccus hospitalis KIN4/I]HIH90020.1 asparagine synthase (glutamine-hydrolyzing) [Desulfurococcaceae archaeon]
MCGIVAVSCARPCVEERRLVSALDAIEHRGPDGRGYWISEDRKTALGNVRLAIIDPKDEGLQPMFNEDGSVGVVLNGEIYNYKEIRQNLKDEHEFLSNTDTEVLLHAYEEMGVDVVHSLRGMFAFAIYDERKGTIFVARDHVGKKPLFYYQGEDFVVLASEPSAIKAFVKNLSKNPLGAFYLFAHFSPLPEQHFFENVKLLRNGEYMIIKDGKVIEKKKYYTLKFDKRVSDITSYVKELHRELIRAVEYRLIADVPVSLALSSGVDSTLLASIITKELNRNDVSTFTVTVKGAGEFDEVELASKVAEELNLDHAVVEFDFEDYIKLTYELTKKVGLPITDPSLVMGYGMAKAARERGYKVIIVGEGGDELFFGYPVYKQIYELTLTLSSLPLLELPFWVVKEVRSYYNKALCYATLHKLVTARGLSLRSQCCEAFPPELCDLLVLSYRVLESLSAPRNLAERLLSYEYNQRIPNHLNLKVDFYSMAASVEARAPLLDYKLIEKAMSLDPAWKRYIMMKEPKLIGKLILKKYLSEETWRKVTSRKVGFGQQAKDVLMRIAEEEAPSRLKSSEILKKVIDPNIFERYDTKRLSFVAWQVFSYSVWEEVIATW